MLRSSFFKTKDDSRFIYGDILEQVKSFFNTKYTKLISASDSIDKDWQTKQIVRYLTQQEITSEENTPVEEVAEAFYADMHGNSFIDKYVSMPGFQELNINAWNYARVKINDVTTVVDDTFISPEHAEDVVKRIVQSGENSTEKLDQSSPKVISNLSEDTRIAASISPIVSKETAVFASIRKVNSALATDSELVSTKEATPEILDFLKFSSTYGTSVCMAGSTGSGKSTLEGYILKYLSLAKKKRVVIIQDGSRQISITEYGKDGRPINDVVSFLTRRNENKDLDIDQSDLIELMVKSDPDVVCVDEMVSSEALDTIRAGRTGHIVLSSIHSQAAEKTYSNIATLALKAQANYSFDTLMRLTMEAFPIIVYVKKMEDKVRRVTEAIEGERYDPVNGPVCRTLYRFNTLDTVYHSDGSVEVLGEHEKVSGISEGLQHLLLGNGAPRAEVEKYAKGA